MIHYSFHAGHESWGRDGESIICIWPVISAHPIMIWATECLNGETEDTLCLRIQVAPYWPCGTGSGLNWGRALKYKEILTIWADLIVSSMIPSTKSELLSTNWIGHATASLPYTNCLTGDSVVRRRTSREHTIMSKNNCNDPDRNKLGRFLNVYQVKLFQYACDLFLLFHPLPHPFPSSFPSLLGPSLGALSFLHSGPDSFNV